MPTKIEILEDLKLTDLSIDEQNKVVAQITETLQNRVAMRIDDLLSDEEKTEFDKLIKEGDQEKSDKYLDEKVPALNEIVVEEYGKLRYELISKNEVLSEALNKATEDVK